MREIGHKLAKDDDEAQEYDHKMARNNSLETSDMYRVSISSNIAYEGPFASSPQASPCIITPCQLYLLVIMQMHITGDYPRQHDPLDGTGDYYGIDVHQPQMLPHCVARGPIQLLDFLQYLVFLSLSTKNMKCDREEEKKMK